MHYVAEKRKRGKLNSKGGIFVLTLLQIGIHNFRETATNHANPLKTFSPAPFGHALINAKLLSVS